jgi:hypothetical protein
MPVILVTWEAEIGRTMIPGQLQQKKFGRSHLNRKKLVVVAHTCHPAMVGNVK